MIELLRQKGADVRYHDPYVPTIQHNGFEMAGETDPNAAPFGSTPKATRGAGAVWLRSENIVRGWVTAFGGPNEMARSP